MIGWANQIPGMLVHVSSTALWAGETNRTRRNSPGANHDRIT